MPSRRGNQLFQRAWAWPLLCCATVLFAILLSQPFNQTGIDDDWSYARVALRLAETGQIHYNGWGSPLQLTQTLWSVPFIRIFGFSFPVLQASAIPWSLGFVLLVYATGRRAGISAELSAFAAIGTGTSPLFLPLAASFMTEPCACFFGMACIYCAVRALASDQPARWVWLLAVAGLLGGANRQSVWAAPVTLLPLIGWERRTQAALRNQIVVAFATLIAAIAVILHFYSPPYAGLRLDPTVLSNSGPALQQFGRMFLLCILLGLPAFVLCLPRPSRERRLRRVIFALALPLMTLAGVLVGIPIAPYGDTMMTAAGLVFQEQNNDSAAILPIGIVLVLTGLVNICAVRTAVYVFRTFHTFRTFPTFRAVRRPLHSPVVKVFAVFALSYAALLISPALLRFLYDRYAVPMIPVAYLAVATTASRRSTRVTPLAWACLVLFAGYAVATTHDYGAALRAKVACARSLESSGVERARISAAVEYDGWGRLERTEHVRETMYSDRFTDDTRKGFWFQTWDHFADFRPDFVVLNWTGPKTPEAGISSEAFNTWLPPYRRYVVVWKRSDLTNELQAARVVSETVFR